MCCHRIWQKLEIWPKRYIIRKSDSVHSRFCCVSAIFHPFAFTRAFLCPPGVFKGLHLPNTTTALHQPNQSTHTNPSVAPTFLQPSSNSTTPSPANAVPSTPSAHAAAALGILGCSAANATPATTQVLIGNNICLSVPSAASLAGRHIPRTLGNVPPSALKLSTTTNLQMPKVSGASSMDLGSRSGFVTPAQH